MSRIFDILLSLIGLLVLFPILLPVALILKFTGEGEVFFLQERVGENGKIFNLIKFSTMLKASPNLGAGNITLKDDPRVLPFGRFLRRTKVNEFPQLLNILLGHMSLVGPRPLTCDLFDKYPQTTQDIIKSLRPGLSGIGSIIFRNEEQILHSSPESKKFYVEVILQYKGSLEEWFAKNNSLFVYFTIIILTIWVVVFPNSNIVFRIFSDLPPIPSALRETLSPLEK